MKQGWAILAGLFLLVVSAGAQQKVLLLNEQDRRAVDGELHKKDAFFHTGLRPYAGAGLDTIREYRPSPKSSLIGRKLREESLLTVDKPDFQLAIDPILHLEMGMDLRDTSAYADTTSLYRNTRGIMVRGRIGETVTFSSAFRENQAFLPQYLRQYTLQREVVPGQGRVKPFKQTGFDFARATGQVTYAPMDRFLVRFGHGKHFIGEGYRSLLLSDNAFDYPYLQFTTGGWQDRIRYTTILASLQSLDRLPKGDTPEPLFKRKAGTFHHLSFLLHPKIRWGFFEGVIWQRWKNGTRAIDWGMFNPVMFVNTAMNGFGDENNALLGTEFRAGPFHGISLYGQFALDDPGKHQWGYQAGLKVHDLPWEGLFAQVEYNTLQPFTYSHPTTLQNYGHYAQPLAHPMGSGVQEWVGRLGYRYKGLYIDLKWVQAGYTLGGTQDAGKNIFISKGEYLPLQPVEEGLVYQDIQLGYTLNPENNLNLMVGYRGRDLTSKAGGQQTGYAYLGLRTAFSNFYYDL